MRTYTKRIWSIVLVSIALMSLAGQAQAQDTGLRLSLKKQFGFSAGGQIQGRFQVSVRGPANLSSVNFTLEDEAGATQPLVLGEVSQPPFSLNFSTDTYPHGHYRLSASGHTSDGQSLTSNVLRLEFVSAEAGWQITGKIMLPILVVVGLILILATLGPLLMSGEDKGSSGRPHYGLAGGTVCPKCGRTFGLHWWAPNLFLSKYDRCPHCGRWNVVRRASRQALDQAQAAADAAAGPNQPEISPEEKLRRQIEESRYM